MTRPSASMFCSFTLLAIRSPVASVEGNQRILSIHKPVL
jgi:hypothetical protein